MISSSASITAGMDSIQISVIGIAGKTIDWSCIVKINAVE